MNVFKVFFICIFTLGVIICTIDSAIHPTTKIPFQSEFLSRNTTPLQKTIIIQTYTPHSQILITSNSHFVSEGFVGTGTFDDPYRIENLNITASSGDLISISNTTVYFCINDNFLDGLATTTSGISLSNVRHATIENNLINSNGDGIKATDTSDTIFRNNSIYLNVRFGIFLVNATNCTLTSNTIHDNLLNGVHLKNTHNTTISNNHIYNHQYGEYSHSSILLDNSSSILIINNSLFNNHYGINLLNSATDNLIANNTVYENQQYGIRLEYATRNLIEYNTISENLLYGIRITIGSKDNTIRFNNFTENNDGKTQATDDGGRNIFTGNYWNDWPTQDINEDLINDNPYPINGKANNSDLYPLVEFSSEAIKNIKKDSDNLGIQLFILIVLVVIVASTGGGYFLYKTRFKKLEIETDFETEEPFIEFTSAEQIDRLKPLYHKIVVGLENIQMLTLPEPIAVPLLKPAETITLIEYFPSDIKEDLRSGLKWRTVLTLIEIAYQDPSETNVVKLSKSMDIPRSTLSKEIKRLTDLHYIESFVTTKTLRDARFRNYTITPKGFKLLYILKEAFKLAIARIKEKQRDYYV